MWWLKLLEDHRLNLSILLIERHYLQCLRSEREKGEKKEVYVDERERERAMERES
jgi:hypothetical protein